MQSVRPKPLLLALAAAAVLAIGSPVSAQSAAEPGPEHKKLGSLLGSWDAVVKPAQGPESKGTANYSWGPGKLWVLSTFRSEFGGQKFEGRGMTGYDPVKKKYIDVWIDSMGPGLTVLEGAFDAEGKVLTQSGESSGPDGKPIKAKTVTESTGKDTMVFKMFVVDDGKDNLAMTIEYKKQPPKPKKPTKMDESKMDVKPTPASPKAL